jgi:Rrf2 family protein
MRISAKADYAIRALLELAASPTGSLKAEQIAERQQIPLNFLENIMIELRETGFVRAHRGVNGGYWISHPAELITLVDVLEAIDGPLVTIHGSRLDEVAYPGVASRLADAWTSVDEVLRGALGRATVADLVQPSAGALDRVAAS